MDDADLLRQALEALKEPALNTPDLQHRIAARLAEIYAGSGQRPAADNDSPLDSSIPIIPPSR
jgi:hypothetical protein